MVIKFLLRGITSLQQVSGHDSPIIYAEQVCYFESALFFNSGRLGSIKMAENFTFLSHREI